VDIHQCKQCEKLRTSGKTFRIFVLDILHIQFLPLCNSKHCDILLVGCLRNDTIKTTLLTLRLLMSYIYIYIIYMELLVKPEMLTSYIYGPKFGNAETVSFYLLHNVSTLNQCREVSCVTFVCKHFAS